MFRFSALIHRIFGSLNRVSSDILAHPLEPPHFLFFRHSFLCLFDSVLSVSHASFLSLVALLFSLFIASFRYSVSVAASLPRTRISCSSLSPFLLSSLSSLSCSHLRATFSFLYPSVILDTVFPFVHGFVAPSPFFNPQFSDSLSLRAPYCSFFLLRIFLLIFPFFLLFPLLCYTSFFFLYFSLHIFSHFIIFIVAYHERLNFQITSLRKFTPTFALHNIVRLRRT